MAQLDLIARKFFFKIIYFGLNTGENNRSIEILKENAKSSERIHVEDFDHFSLKSFSIVTLPNIGPVMPIFELLALSMEESQDPLKTSPFHLADAVILVVNPKTSLKEKNIHCFQQMISCLHQYQRSLENISFIIQYSADREINFFQLRDSERELHYDEFVSFSVNLKTGDGVLETLEEIASDLFDVFSSLIEDNTSLEPLLLAPSSLSGIQMIPSIAAQTTEVPENLEPPSGPSSLPFYGDLPPKKGPPFYGDLPTSLPEYGQHNPKFPTYGDIKPSQKNPGFSYGLPPGNEPFPKKPQPPYFNL
ncbi:MAG: hypothetical protein AABZ60_23065 [Planctomycetota bacterium]